MKTESAAPTTYDGPECQHSIIACGPCIAQRRTRKPDPTDPAVRVVQSDGVVRRLPGWLIEEYRARGQSWNDIAREHSVDSTALRESWARWMGRAPGSV